MKTPLLAKILSKMPLMRYMGESKMRKIIALGIMLLFLGMTISSTTGIYLEKQSVKPTSFGNTLYVGGSGLGNYTKIQDAINDSSDGDTVFVYDDSSPYFENVVVHKSINLVGEDKDTTVIDGNDTVDVVYVSADWVNISGFKIRNISYNPYNPFAGMGISIGSNYCTITGNIISDIDSTGLRLRWHSKSNTITGNTISNNYEGIWLDYSDSNTINGNNISENNEGIVLADSSGNTITGNTIISNDVYGVWLDYSDSNTINGNNTISNNLFGIYLSNSNSNTITGNTISNNDYDGIILWYYSSSNTILKNNFLNNQPHASFENCKNTWKQNYWNRPRLLPKLIFGTMKLGNFTIPWINIDWRPALVPYDI